MDEESALSTFDTGLPTTHSVITVYCLFYAIFFLCYFLFTEPIFQIRCEDYPVAKISFQFLSVSLYHEKSNEIFQILNSKTFLTFKKKVLYKISISLPDLAIFFSSFISQSEVE